METRLAVPALMMIAVLGVCSCRSFWAETATVPVVCVVQPESSLVYEVALDGKLVGSCKVAPRTQMAVNFEATRGEHILLVTAPGMEPCQKTIAVTGAGNNMQAFFIDLKPSGR